MSSGFLGMDVNEVGRAYRGVGSCAGDLGQIMSKVTSFVLDLQQNRKWTGQDADAFFGKFSGEVDPLVSRATGELDGQPDRLKRRIDAQQDASQR